MDRLDVTPLPYHPLLFYPSSRQVSLTSAECPPPVSPFIGRPGKYPFIVASILVLRVAHNTLNCKITYLIGQITPSLAKVKVDVINSTSAEVVTTVETLPNGTYVAGPLYDDVAYRAVWFLLPPSLPLLSLAWSKSHL